MFSFIKNLFNFQKTDANPVQEKQQVKFESHTRLENVKIKAIKDLEKSSSNNESYQKVQSKYFHSNKEASTSSETNAHSSISSQSNTICTTKRVCARLAAKRITKNVEELSLQSDEGESIIDEGSKQETSKKPKLIKKSHRLRRKIIRLCPNCKTLKTMIGNVSKGKNCNLCGSILMYLCTKCEAKHYITYARYIIHELKCNGKSINRKVKNNRNKSKLHNCPDCDMRIFNEKSLRFQLIKTNNTAVCDNKEDIKGARDDINNEGKTKNIPSNAAITVKRKRKNYQTGLSRFCQICQKTVMGVSMGRHVACETCNTPLLYQCIKCFAKYTSYSGLYRHFKIRCFPNGQNNSALCSTKWRQTQGVKSIYFKCDMCIYESKFKNNLIRHIKAIHKEEGVL